MKSIFLKGLLFFGLILNAQNDKKLSIALSGFVETYYAYDFNSSGSESKLPFMYNYNRHNEVNLNLGLLRAKVDYDNTYASIAFHSGTYVDDNYANEKIKFINEAFVGLYLDNLKKHSIEVGIIPSYIGFESAASATNLTLTRSILAENSPYFMTGIKYNNTVSERLKFSFFITNGWQRISRENKKLAPSIGTQLVYSTATNSLFNWSTFVGEEFNGIDFSPRYFSNLYWDKKWDSQWRTIVGFDFGLQNKSQVGNSTQMWYSPVVISQYTISPKWQTAFRAEYYQDKNNVLITTLDEFKTVGFSMNLDYLLNDKTKFRTELRHFNSENNLIENSTMNTTSNLFFTSSLCFEF